MYFHIYIHNYICLGIGYIKPPYASIHCTIHIQIHMPTSPAASPVHPAVHPRQSTTKRR